MAEIEKRSEHKLDDLSRLINEEHRAFIGAFRKTAEHGIRAGELLSEAKSKCKHGDWLPWLEANFEDAPRTAQEYMRLYKHRDEIRAKYAESAHLSIDTALKEISAPKDNRDLGFEWEKAYRAWSQALETPEEAQCFATLRELDHRVRPADLPPSRLHGSFAEELTDEEMNRTFDELIRTGSIADWETTREDHLWRMQVVRNVLEEMPDGEDRDKFLRDLVEAGTVRPHPVDAVEALLEHEAGLQEREAKLEASLEEAQKALEFIARLDSSSSMI